MKDSYFSSDPNLQDIDQPIHETVRMPTLCSFVPQSKSLGSPLEPDAGAQYGIAPITQLGEKDSVVWPV